MGGQSPSWSCNASCRGEQVEQEEVLQFFRTIAFRDTYNDRGGVSGEEQGSKLLQGNILEETG